MEKKRFKEKLISGEFVVTAELCPPRGPEIEKFLQKAQIIKDVVDGVNVTDNQRSIMRFSALGAAILLKQQGIDPILQITCRDRNRIALQSDLLAASGFGIKNILCLTGDYVTDGDHPEAKPVFDLDATLLLKTAVTLNSGFAINGRKINGKAGFFLGAAINPCAEPLEVTIANLERKIEAGAQFFQTQAIFDVSKFAKFMERVSSYNVKIITGILLVKSPKMVRYLNEKVPGVDVPEKYINRIEKSSDPLETGIEICKELIEEVRHLGNGIHIMTIGMEELVPRILS